MRRIDVERWIAGSLLGLAQIVLALARGHDLFLSPRELFEFALATLFGLGASVAVVGALLDPARRNAGEKDGARVRVAYAALGTALGGWLGWLLSAGRRVHDHPLRPLGSGLFGLLLGA